MANCQQIIFPWLTRRWTDTRDRLSKKITSIAELDNELVHFHAPVLKPRQTIDIFGRYFDGKDADRDYFLDEILPFMQRLIVAGPKEFRGVRVDVLLPGQCKNMAFTRPQIATVIACMWFGLFDYNYLTDGPADADLFPEPTLVNVFTSANLFPFSCVMNYFSRIHQCSTDPDDDFRALFNAGNVIMKRSTCDPVNWTKITDPICQVAVSDENIDDINCKVHTAFAHEYIGGDLFKNNVTQEEIILLIRPECLVAVLFCARLDNTDSLVILGAEKMSQYTGYGSSINYAGNYDDPTPKGYSKDDTEVMTQNAVIFINASKQTTSTAQFINCFAKDADKAFCGFDSLQFSQIEPIATGHWTYDTNGCNPQVKFIQQLLAASHAGKCLVYHPPGNDFLDILLPFIDWLQKTRPTVGTLFDMYRRVIAKCGSGPGARLSNLDVFAAIYDL